jgi:hypothetical protein
VKSVLQPCLHLSLRHPETSHLELGLFVQIRVVQQRTQTTRVKNGFVRSICVLAVRLLAVRPGMGLFVQIRPASPQSLTVTRPRKFSLSRCFIKLSLNRHTNPRGSAKPPGYREGEKSCMTVDHPSTKEKHEKLTKAERDHLPDSEFALPEKRQYPIPDRYHAELALRDLHSASVKDQVSIRQAIRKKFPGLN